MRRVCVLLELWAALRRSERNAAAVGSTRSPNQGNERRQRLRINVISCELFRVFKLIYPIFRKLIIIKATFFGSIYALMMIFQFSYSP